jgi:solute carrier family 25 carnitine/acylcarnitine transporter 20/29
LIVTPIEGVKSRLQVQYSSNSALYGGPIDCVRSILKSEGLRGLYNGWTCVAFCRLSNYAYFGSYEIFKNFFQSKHKDKTLSSLELITCGGLAGISYWFSCYPVDLIKARLMVAAAQRAMIANNPSSAASDIPFSVRSIFHSIYAKHGWRGFFAGFGPCLIRAFPANAAAFITYEKVIKILPTTI